MGKGKVIKDAAEAVVDMILSPKGKGKGKAKPRLKPGEYVRERQRTNFPGIYERPDVIARTAAARTAPESPALRELFGVTRDDLYGMSQDRSRNAPSIVPFARRPQGSYAADNVMTDRNRQRLTDTLAEAAKYPELYRGMDSWYNMDPMLTRLRELSSTPESDFGEINAFLAMASPGSAVTTEIPRGAAARYMAQRGRFDDFAQYGGAPTQLGVPDELWGVPGHPYHSTAQVPGMRALAEGRGMVSEKGKVPAYMQASLPAELGGSWQVPVGDAHWSRAIGLADVRRDATPNKSVSVPELQTLTPWWQKIARDVDLEAVPAQARAWGAFSHATGVDTPVGAPKLELLADAIKRAAFDKSVPAPFLRDRFLLGEDMLSGTHKGNTRARRGLLDMVDPRAAEQRRLEQELFDAMQEFR